MKTIGFFGSKDSPTFEALSDCQKLEAIAAAFDKEQFVLGKWDGADGSTQIQDSLRSIAKKIASLVEKLGPQRATPSSVGKIQAETKQVRRRMEEEDAT